MPLVRPCSRCGEHHDLGCHPGVCQHGVEVGRPCERCPFTKTPPYVYNREQVIALNPIRAAQGLPPLTKTERYEDHGLRKPKEFVRVAKEAT